MKKYYESPLIELNDVLLEDVIAISTSDTIVDFENGEVDEIW